MTQDVVEVEIYGNKFKIKQPASNIDVREVAEYFDAKIRAVAQTAPTGSSLHLVILAGLNICHEFFELKNEGVHTERSTEEKLDNIIRKLEMIPF